MPFFTQFLNYIEVGQMDLINEIYRNNYRACIKVPENLISLIVQNITHKQKKQGFGGHHLKYLLFLKSIMVFKKTILANNFIKVYNVLIQ